MLIKSYILNLVIAVFSIMPVVVSLVQYDKDTAELISMDSNEIIEVDFDFEENFKIHFDEYFSVFKEQYVIYKRVAYQMILQEPIYLNRLSPPPEYI